MGLLESQASRKAAAEERRAAWTNAADGETPLLVKRKADKRAQQRAKAKARAAAAAASAGHPVEDSTDSCSGHTSAGHQSAAGSWLAASSGHPSAEHQSAASSGHPSADKVDSADSSSGYTSAGHDKCWFELTSAASAGHPSSGHPSSGHPSAGHPSVASSELPSAARSGHPSSGHQSAGHPSAGHPSAASSERPSAASSGHPSAVSSSGDPSAEQVDSAVSSSGPPDAGHPSAATSMLTSAEVKVRVLQALQSSHWLPSAASSGHPSPSAASSERPSASSLGNPSAASSERPRSRMQVDPEKQSRSWRIGRSVLMGDYVAPKKMPKLSSQKAPSIAEKCGISHVRKVAVLSHCIECAAFDQQLKHHDVRCFHDRACWHDGRNLSVQLGVRSKTAPFQALCTRVKADMLLRKDSEHKVIFFLQEWKAQVCCVCRALLPVVL